MADDDTTEPTPHPPTRVTRNVALGITNSQAVDVTKGATVNVEFPANISMTAQAPDVLTGNPSIFTITEEEEEEEESGLPPGILEAGQRMEAQTTVPLSAREALAGRASGNLASNAPLAGGTGVHETAPGRAQLDAAGLAAEGEAGSIRNYTLDLEAGRFTLEDGSTSPPPPPNETTAAPPEPNAIHATAEVVLSDVSQAAHGTVEQPRRMRTAIGTLVQRNRVTIVLQVAALMPLIDRRLAELRDARPNAVEAKAEREDAIARYEAIKQQLEAVCDKTLTVEDESVDESAVEQFAKSFGTLTGLVGEEAR
jgi:hypothetical protein